jgi:ribokinase
MEDSFMPARIVVVGSLNMDLVTRAERIPQPGETILGGDLQTFPGGKGANQAVAARRIGAQVAMIGRVGQDAFAAPLLQALGNAGVDSSHVLQDPSAATGVAIIVVDQKGQNSIVVCSGANAHLSPQDIRSAESTIAGADALLLQLESPLETVREAAEIARDHGVRVILNPAPARPLPEALLRNVDVLVPNESEASLLTGLPVKDIPQVEAAAARLHEMGAEAVVVTLGERGALYLYKGESHRVPAFEVTPVDTTAAGDAFMGGFAVALAEGKPFAEAVRWGNAAGALATTKMGAQPSLPERGAVENLILKS